MINLIDIVDKMKKEIVNYTGNDTLSEKIISDINIEFLAPDEFLKLSGASSFSDGPGAFHKRDNNTVYMLRKANYNNRDIHNVIHELLHAYSNNYANSGKEGLIVYGYDENDRLISAGGTLNEAATEYLTSIINNDGFVGYPNDMKYIFELFIDILNVRVDFVNIYFSSEFWITDEMNIRFNSSKINQLDEFVLEFDNRLPMYRKHPFDFNKTISILLDAINDKITNFIDINYESILKNLFLITKCGFDLSQDNFNKIKYLQEVIKSVYGVDFKQNDLVDEQIYEEGKIKMFF